jgi:hypothetical protein
MQAGVSHFGDRSAGAGGGGGCMDGRHSLVVRGRGPETIGNKAITEGDC